MINMFHLIIVKLTKHQFASTETQKTSQHNGYMTLEAILGLLINQDTSYLFSRKFSQEKPPHRTFTSQIPHQETQPTNREAKPQIWLLN